MAWSDKYKKSINCNNPKGFSQKAHCAGRKKRNEMKLKISQLKEVIKRMVEARGPSRGFNKLATTYQKEALKHQGMVKDQKRLAAAFVAEKDPKKKEKAKKAIIAHHKKVQDQEKKMKRAEREMLTGLDKEKIEMNEITLGKLAKKYPKSKDKFIDAFFALMKNNYGPTFKDFEKDKKYRNAIGKVWDNQHGVKESINEGPSTEEKRIAMLAVRKQAKYRNVDLASAIQDQINALKELQRDVKRGKIKK